MKHHGHWSKFSDAIRDLRDFPALPKYANLFAIAARLLEVAQRFYFPDGAYVLDGKEIDEEVKRLARPPYDAIAILSECGLNEVDGSRIGSTWIITICLALESDLNIQLRVVQPNSAANYALFSIHFHKEVGRWGMAPVIVAYTLKPDVQGYGIGLFDDGLGSIAEIERMGRAKGNEVPLLEEFRENASVVLNLCALLGTGVSKPARIVPPEKLNKRRITRGNLPLYDYHVLEVGGERWDGPYQGAGEGRGVRSHLRRGHIRRLSETRFTWVRSTLVRGSVRGFVDKDYVAKAHTVSTEGNSA